LIVLGTKPLNLGLRFVAACFLGIAALAVSSMVLDNYVGDDKGPEWAADNGIITFFGVLFGALCFPVLHKWIGGLVLLGLGMAVDFYSKGINPQWDALTARSHYLFGGLCAIPILALIDLVWFLWLRRIRDRGSPQLPAQPGEPPP